MGTNATKEDYRLILSSSPHAHKDISIPRIMYTVVIALLPATVFSVYLFGWNAAKVLCLSVAVAMATEAAIRRIRRMEITVLDGSAVVTGLLLAMNLPPSLPWWMVILGAVVAIGLGKEVYGGLGCNPFNPALVARVVLLISFPVQMTTWLLPGVRHLPANLDAVTGATPLDILKLEGVAAVQQKFSTWDLFMGNIGGSLGEMSALLLLIGAVLLLWKGYISWHTPVAFVGSVAAISFAFWAADPSRYADPIFHIFSGGVILGAFFMATDMVTTPVTPAGMLYFGAGCGIITMVIRIFGGYPEGVSFSILLMNAMTPLLDLWTRPKVFGEVRTDG